MIAFAATVPLACLAMRARAVTLSGALSGIAISVILSLTPTAAALIVFLLFVVLGSAGSRLGSKEKKALGVMQSDHGRRTWWHAWANAGPAATAVAAAAIVRHFGAFDFGLAEAELFATGSIAAMLADTIAGEWGTLKGGQPRSIVTFRPVPIGTDGGVTLSGMLAATAMSILAAAIAVLFHHRSSTMFVAISCAGFFGNVVDSILGATIEPRLGRHSGAWVNAAAATSGGLIALFLG